MTTYAARSPQHRERVPQRLRLEQAARAGRTAGGDHPQLRVRAVPAAVAVPRETRPASTSDRPGMVRDAEHPGHRRGVHDAVRQVRGHQDGFRCSYGRTRRRGSSPPRSTRRPGSPRSPRRPARTGGPASTPAGAGTLASTSLRRRLKIRPPVPNGAKTSSRRGRTRVGTAARTAMSTRRGRSAARADALVEALPEHRGADPEQQPDHRAAGQVERLVRLAGPGRQFRVADDPPAAHRGGGQLVEPAGQRVELGLRPSMRWFSRLARLGSLCRSGASIRLILGPLRIELLELRGQRADLPGRCRRARSRHGSAGTASAKACEPDCARRRRPARRR